jgi:SAM-dependent methyltransferase
MSETSSPTSYDRMPYPRAMHRRTHPDHVAALAMLFGMTPAPADRCRVLELGCAAGANLIPMAAALPDSQFVGLDLSARQVADGRAAIEALGLRNIRLERADLLDVGADLGPFDYLVAHGLYSWVPPAVRERILELAALLLRPNGVAYVSYGTYPGGHPRRMVREMMRYHARGETEPAARVAAARALLPWLLQGPPADLPEYTAILKNEQDVVTSRSDSHLYHDHLAEINEPSYFHEFAYRAAAHGLQYLADAYFPFPQLPPRAAEALGPLDLVALEQYADFFSGRSLRMSLLCRAGIPVTRPPGADRLAALYVSSPTRCASPTPDLHSEKVEEFRAPDGRGLSTSSPLVKAAFRSLEEMWPRAVTPATLLVQTISRLTGASGPAADPSLGLALCEVLLAGVAGGVVELHALAPRFVTEVSERPVASPVARWEAVQGTVATTLRHEPLYLDDPLLRHVLRHCDGSHDRAALLGRLEELAADERLGVPHGGLVDMLDKGLTTLARSAVLVG